MNIKEQFEFINSDLWIQTTQVDYEPPKQIKHLISNYGYKRTDWNAELENKIINLRKLNSMPFLLKNVGQNFWYYHTDQVAKRISDIERKGEQLYTEINKHGTYKNAFKSDARAEEAIMSAIYEGANTTRKDAKKFIANKERPKTVAQWMVRNNYDANKWINENKNLTLDRELILNLHKIVTKNTLSEEDAPYRGKFRDNVVHVGRDFKNVHTGINKDKIPDAIDEAIEAVTNNGRYIHPLIRGILLHYFIAYIHPFFDGNGRTARTLFYFKCLKHGLDWVNFLSISASLKAHGNQYENSFKLVEENQWDMTYFILYSLKCLENALNIVDKKVKRLGEMCLLQSSMDLTDGQLGVIQRLYLHSHAVIEVKAHADNIGKSGETARRELKELEAKKLLIELKIKNKSYYQVNKEAVDELVEELL